MRQFTPVLSVAVFVFASICNAETTNVQHAKTVLTDSTSATKTVDARSTGTSDGSTTRTLGDLLSSPRLERPKGPGLTGYFAEIPASLEKGVRYIAEDNYTSAVAVLAPELSKAKDAKERARVQMWLGLCHGQQAVDYPSMGHLTGTSATAYLKEAIAADREVLEAPDAARMLAEMLANGWAGEDPTVALQRTEQEAEKSKRAVDFYLAAIISKRLSARAWSYSDTTEQDKKTLSLLTKALTREPQRYETWSTYLRALMPVGLHDMATTDAKKMYAFFQNLRTPVLGDQGPALLFQQTSSYRTMQDDEQMLADLGKKWPDAPLPPFEMAMRAIETTASLALQLFPEFLTRVEKGSIKLEPREQGYYVSALYKAGFLLQQDKKIPESRAMYERVKSVSPNYAEVDLNLAIINAQMADGETTGPKKLQLLEKAISHTEVQEKHDYRGRASLKAFELRQQLRIVARQVKNEILAKSPDAATTASATSTSTTVGGR